MSLEPTEVICELFLSGHCSPENIACPRIHTQTPYLWQIQIEDLGGWVTVENYNEQLEDYYSDPERCDVVIEVRRRNRIAGQTNCLI